MWIEGYHISISHTLGYVAVILSRDYEVGVDIEYVSDRVNRISSRFLRDDEVFADLTEISLEEATSGKYRMFQGMFLGTKEQTDDFEQRFAASGATAHASRSRKERLG